MPIVTEAPLDGAANSDFLDPASAAFRAAVDTVAARAKAAFPASHSRIDEAVILVLAGGVEIFRDGTSRIPSERDGTIEYHITNGSCACEDVAQALQGWCVHRLAAAIARRATEQARQPGPQAPAPVKPPTIPAEFVTEVHGKQFVRRGVCVPCKRRNWNE